MAKRRKEKDEEEEKPFKLPKFDEEAFLKRERRNIKATFISFLFGFLMALVCFGFWALMGRENPFRWELVLLVAVVDAVFLRYILVRFGIDLSDFQRKNWFGSYATYFVTWLIILIVLTNPPFYDDEDPRMEIAVLPEIQEPGGDILVVAKITDNVGIDKSSLSLEITEPDDNITILSVSNYDYEDIIVIFTYQNSENKLGDFDYILTAKDVNGQERKETGSFTYKNNAMEITSSRFENITSGDDITIEVEEDISPANFRVYYKIDDSEEINVNRKYKDIKAEYETSPEYEGWSENSKFNLTLFVEVSHYFTNVPEKYSNIVEHTKTYKFSTTQGSNIGDEESPVPWNWSKSPQENKENNLLNYDDYNKNKDPKKQILLPYPETVQAPGFETVIFLISLAAVVLIFKYKKKNRSNQK
ncbi:hypothetical protein AYK21_01760 [Thermoplasmatales archaeon SG8-52-2]|nr:MAG: hypothetical protein AYK21_01760 [Thermoplasmatales archaeon SG8-52-2]